MARVTVLESYSDDQGNEIVYGGRLDHRIKIKFTGSNNRVVVHDDARIGQLTVDLDCDNGRLEIGPSRGVPAFSAAIRIGQDSTVIIGENVSTTSSVAMSATEGTTITVGDDVMFASENQVRADDGHPIFDVRTGKRVNVSRSIHIGNHVWLARHAVVLGGASIGDGTVIGYGSIVTRRLPNNCVAAGSPAVVIRRNVAWERPHLSLVKPYYKKSIAPAQRSPYWNLTAEEPTPKKKADWRSVRKRAVRKAKRAAKRVLP